MDGAIPIGAPLKRCHQDQRQCLTIQPYDDGTAELYDDAVEGGLRLRFPIDEVRQFIANTAAANPGYTKESADNKRYATLASTNHIVAMNNPTSGDWILTDRELQEIELVISAADARMFVVGAVDGTFASITEGEAAVTIAG